MEIISGNVFSNTLFKVVDSFCCISYIWMTFDLNRNLVCVFSDDLGCVRYDFETAPPTMIKSNEVKETLGYVRTLFIQAKGMILIMHCTVTTCLAKNYVFPTLFRETVALSLIVLWGHFWRLICQG